MEPNNFEKDFREKLNQRKIEPSDKAWDRLDAMLGVAENRKPKKDRKWLYIAASIMGFLLVGTFFLNQKKDIQTTPENAVVIEKTTTKEPVVKPALNNVEAIKTETVIAEKTSKENGTKKEKKDINPKSNQILQNESKQIAESSIIIKKDQEKQSINNKSLVAETSKKETVDQLLESAEKTVVAENSAKPKSKVKINANDLLNQVDGELELSFREKMITKVNKNYQSVKVALANRNQQE